MSAATCPQCSLPMVWSDAQQRMWCCVYGSHQHPVTITPTTTHAQNCICLKCRPIRHRSTHKKVPA